MTDKLEVLTVRDPDGGTDVTLFINGELVLTYTGETVDAGAGAERRDWEEHTREVAANPDYSPAFKQAVLEARADPPGVEYIEDDPDDEDAEYEDGYRVYDHRARPDDLPEPGDRCKDCGHDITWMGPSHYDWLHVDEEGA